MHFFSRKELGKCQGQKGTRECFSISHIEDEIRSIFSRAKLKAIKNNNNDNPQWVWHKRNLKSKLLWVHMFKYKLEMGEFKIKLFQKTFLGLSSKYSTRIITSIKLSTTLHKHFSHSLIIAFIGTHEPYKI